MPRPLSIEARDKALEAAAALVAEAGIEGFTIDEVARRSGVAKSTLYRHWTSANELLVSAIDCHIEHIPTPDTGSLHGDLVRLLETLRPLLDDEGNRRLMIEMLAAAARDPELERIKRTMLAERTAPIGTIVRRAVERGEIPPIDDDRATLFVHGTVTARTLIRGEPIDEAEVGELADLIVRGLGGTPPAGSSGA